MKTTGQLRNPEIWQTITPETVILSNIDRRLSGSASKVFNLAIRVLCLVFDGIDSAL